MKNKLPCYPPVVLLFDDDSKDLFVEFTTLLFFFHFIVISLKLPTTNYNSSIILLMTVSKQCINKMIASYIHYTRFVTRYFSTSINHNISYFLLYAYSVHQHSMRSPQRRLNRQLKLHSYPYLNDYQEQ